MGPSTQVPPSLFGFSPPLEFSKGGVSEKSAQLSVSPLLKNVLEEPPRTIQPQQQRNLQ